MAKEPIILTKPKLSVQIHIKRLPSWRIVGNGGLEK